MKLKVKRWAKEFPIHWQSLYQLSQEYHEIYQNLYGTLENLGCLSKDHMVFLFKVAKKNEVIVKMQQQLQNLQQAEETSANTYLIERYQEHLSAYVSEKDAVIREL